MKYRKVEAYSWEDTDRCSKCVFDYDNIGCLANECRNFLDENGVEIPFYFKEDRIGDEA